ncbi:type VI secretion system lipoprotein TssJ [Aquitalea magnusonii]|uniref:Type VI secretion system protein VasD n=1 Tax=Aquitalea magnusonii TaxID=332411 RepID=A0A318JFH5_9NEIS|nr:type VI secretion system lipoprotein TssJ [Aquitalea magnusonii]PXX48822.1 type VI secretion system protein VasD [Aquitalea magnusonii]
MRHALRIMLLLLVLGLAGCGAWQYVKDGSKALTEAVFYPRIKTVKLDVTARAALNPDEQGRSLSVVVRVYQLRDGKAFRAASYEQILGDDKKILGDELLARHDFVLTPDSSYSLDQPLDENAGQIAVVALFRQNGPQTIWRIGLPISVLDNDTPAKLEVKDSQILISQLPHPLPQPAAAVPQTPASPPPQPASAAAASKAKGK